MPLAAPHADDGPDLPQLEHDERVFDISDLADESQSGVVKEMKIQSESSFSRDWSKTGATMGINEATTEQTRNRNEANMKQK